MGPEGRRPAPGKEAAEDDVGQEREVREDDDRNECAIDHRTSWHRAAIHVSDVPAARSRPARRPTKRSRSNLQLLGEAKIASSGGNVKPTARFHQTSRYSRGGA